MKTTLVCTRKYNKEEYKFYINEPSYTGERGCCGIELEPYISVITPKNGFGYTDTILLSHGKAYTLERYLPLWILKKIEKKMVDIMKDYS
ncbi:MAG: hypothetical protein J6S85_13185 [Methanobrevibacter sp.]|nr:hypothetical protein [Methanobrevibacter sp.]